ncbi:MAG: 3-hydroxypropionyl-coenzyme A dehydratase [Candidatus Heimdallarchaeota archaeon LC_2]|nr:MAG: 3-hydroxypropionyl-coenzyme A dehydratase [Candidatus Heimdallarchaeota archaeon LC_2]
MAEYQTLRIEFNKPRQNVVTLTFDRPDALNALNSQVTEDLKLALSELADKKSEVRALIITGEGTKSFVAGADISEMVKLTPPEARNFLHELQQTLTKLEELSFPVIAKINGYALGGGLEVALACDIRIASDNALIGLPEVSLGLIPAGGGTQRLTRLIGEGHSKYLIMTGSRLNAEQALQYGIVSKVVPQEKLDEEVDNLLNKISNLAPIAIGSAKIAIQASFNETLNSGLEIELDEAVKCFQTKDLREGMNAFLEKRRAEFTGK